MLEVKDVLTYFEKPQRIFLTAEQAICYIISRLILGNSYATELINEINSRPDTCCLSDTVCNNALVFLDREGLVTSVRVKVTGKGRPRRVFSLVKKRRADTTALADCWSKWLGERR